MFRSRVIGFANVYLARVLLVQNLLFLDFRDYPETMGAMDATPENYYGINMTFSWMIRECDTLQGIHIKFL